MVSSLPVRTSSARGMAKAFNFTMRLFANAVLWFPKTLALCLRPSSLSVQHTKKTLFTNGISKVAGAGLPWPFLKGLDAGEKVSQRIEPKNFSPTRGACL